MKVLITGDFYPNSRTKQLIESRDFGTIFSQVKAIITDADYSIVNFESPIVECKAQPIEKLGPNLKCTHKGVEAIKYAGFNCVTLANNHIYDFGDIGVQNTLNVLHQNNIDYVGAGMNLGEASKVFYKEVQGRRIAIINCCENEFSIATSTTAGANPINAIQQYYAITTAKQQADKVVVIVHGGHEHYSLPSPRMKELYRFFIDAGANAVINHHQHCYSGYEYYKQGVIVYGLGNFCFDSPNQRNSIWNTGYMAQLDMSVEKIELQLFPYIQSNDTPAVELMKGAEKARFYENIQQLNTIIANDEQLLLEHRKFMKRTSKCYQFSVEPYQNRYLQALFVRGWLPSALRKINRLRIENYLFCESHLDRLRYSIKNLRK